MVIYLITCMVSADTSRKRTWGYYLEFETAEQLVLRNATDMFEEEFDCAVIEEVPDGLLTISKVKQWYRADYSKSQELPTIYKMDAPIWAKDVVNWGIG